MSILHTVNKSPFEKNSLDSCLTHVKEGSVILLIEDGVYAAVKGSSAEGKVQSATTSTKVYALGPDLAARGLTEGRISSGIEIVDYEGFVSLATEHDAVLAWV